MVGALYASSYDKKLKYKLDNDIVFYSIKNHEGFFVLTGEINDNSAIQFSKAVNLFAQNKVQKINFLLNSNGGSVIAGTQIIDIMLLLKEQNVEILTIVRDESLCASMCTAIFATGSTRTAGKKSVWLFHGPFIEYDYDYIPTIEDISIGYDSLAASREILLFSYNSADPEFTDKILLPYIISRIGGEIVVSGEWVNDNSTTWFTESITLDEKEYQDLFHPSSV